VNERLVFLDASFWISLRDEKDAAHEQAKALTKGLLADRKTFLTTHLVFAETHAYFARTRLRSLQVLNDLEGNPVITSEFVLPADQTDAIRILRQHADKSYSFCDAVSFVVMRRLSIRRVATFDEHFRQFGEFEIIS